MHMKQAGILDFGMYFFCTSLQQSCGTPGVRGRFGGHELHRTCRLCLNLPAENIRERADTKSFQSLFTQEQMRKRRLLPTYLQRWASIFFVYVCVLNLHLGLLRMGQLRNAALCIYSLLLHGANSTRNNGDTLYSRG